MGARNVAVQSVELDVAQSSLPQAIQEVVLPAGSQTPDPLWKWDELEKIGFEPAFRMSDEQWLECKKYVRNLPDEARLKLDYVITQAFADREDREATLPTAKTLRQFGQLKARSEALNGILHDILLENMTAAAALEHHRVLLERMLDDTAKVSQIVAEAADRLPSPQTGPDIEAQHLLAARVEHSLQRFGMALSTGKPDNWSKCLNVILKAAGFDRLPGSRAVTLIRRVVANRSGKQAT